MRARSWATRRGASRGVTSLLGGLALCPCGNPAMSNVNHLGTHVYWCPTGNRACPAPARTWPGWPPTSPVGDRSRHHAAVSADAADLLPQQAARGCGRLSSRRTRSGRAGTTGRGCSPTGEIGRGRPAAGTQNASRRSDGPGGQTRRGRAGVRCRPLLAAGDVRAAWDALDLSLQAGCYRRDPDRASAATRPREARHRPRQRSGSSGTVAEALAPGERVLHRLLRHGTVTRCSGCSKPRDGLVVDADLY